MAHLLQVSINPPHLNEISAALLEQKLVFRHGCRAYNDISLPPTVLPQSSVNVNADVVRITDALTTQVIRTLSKTILGPNLPLTSWSET